MKTRTAHPHIEKRKSHRGGRAILRGTNFPVSSVVIYILKHGMLPEELVRTFSHLKLAQVYDALSYYYDHQQEIDAEIEKNLGQDSIALRLGKQKQALRLQYDPQRRNFTVSPLTTSPKRKKTAEDVS